MTVEEARERRVCRICEQPVPSMGPKGWPTEFREMVYPVAVTLNFGDEFAHTQCLKDTLTEMTRLNEDQYSEEQP